MSIQAPGELCRRPPGSDHYRSSSSSSIYIYMTTTTLLVTLNCPMALECGGIRSASSGERRRQVPRAAICASLGNAMTTSAKGRSGDSPGYRMPVPQRARESV